MKGHNCFEELKSDYYKLKFFFFKKKNSVNQKLISTNAKWLIYFLAILAVIPESVKMYFLRLVNAVTKF